MARGGHNGSAPFDSSSTSSPHWGTVYLEMIGTVDKNVTKRNNVTADQSLTNYIVSSPNLQRGGGVITRWMKMLPNKQTEDELIVL